MKRLFIKEVNESNPDEANLQAWVEDISSSETCNKILLLRDASGRINIDAKYTTSSIGDYIKVYCHHFDGKYIAKNEKIIVSFPKEKKELIDTEDFSDKEVLLNRYLVLRQKRLQKNMEVLDEAYSLIFNILKTKYFKYIETPILTKSVYEYTESDFLVKSSLWDKDEEAHLVQSPQLYKQMLISGGVERYFQFAKNFRAEVGDSKHLQEFTQIDAEMITDDRAELIDIIEDIICTLFEQIRGMVISKPFLKATESILPQKIKNGEFDIRWVIDKKMAELHNGKIIPNHHVMTLPQSKDINNIQQSSDLLNATGTGFDLEINGMEVAGGDMRITDAVLQTKVLKLFGYCDTEIEYHYGSLLDMLKKGVPQHGGFAIGLSRICMALIGENNISNMIAFPTDNNSRCVLQKIPFKRQV